MVLGEGAAILVIEDMEKAEKRGAPIIAELAGFGTTSDAAELLRPDPDGAQRAMHAAISDAGLQPKDIGYVNAHGTGTVLNDLVETRALTTIFGSALKEVAVSSTKPVHGHTLGAAGAIELIVSIMALVEKTAPPTMNWLAADPQCELDPVPNRARAIDTNAALSNSFAFGGINASLVVRRV
jgi:nodulation protein E